MDNCYFCNFPLDFQSNWKACNRHIINSDIDKQLFNQIYHFPNMIDYFVYFKGSEYRFVYDYSCNVLVDQGIQIVDLIVCKGDKILSRFDLDKVKHVTPETAINFLTKILNNKAFF